VRSLPRKSGGAAAKRRPNILTIGYEGATLEAFLQALAAARVTRVVDVRELANSRRKGFSKTALAAALREAGIGYQHERALGTPRPLRQRVRATGDLQEFFAAFRRHLAGQGPLLDQLARTLMGPVALLCYERDPSHCHRSVVAAALARRVDAPVRHLAVDLPEPGRRSTRR
jgi:uncharacterized protein (DUF488 family)